MDDRTCCRRFKHTTIVAVELPVTCQVGECVSLSVCELPKMPHMYGEADGNGYGVIAGRRGPSRPPPRASVNLVPLLLTGVRLHPPGRTDKHLCRCFGAPATHARRPHGRVFPDHLITPRVGAIPYMVCGGGLGGARAGGGAWGAVHALWPVCSVRSPMRDGGIWRTYTIYTRYR